MIRLLREDLLERISAFGDDSGTGAGRRQGDAGTAATGSISPEMLACDHPNTLCLSVEDGGDGRPVGSLPRATLRGFLIGQGEPSSIPPARDLVRLGTFLCLGMHCSLALVLKGEWERFLASSRERIPDADPDSVLRDERIASRYKESFNPDTELLFRLFEEHGGQAGRNGYTRATFDTRVQEMILNDLHLAANAGPEIERFAWQADGQQRLMRQATEEEREAFWFAHFTWLDLQEALGEQLFLIESRRRENTRIEQQWLVLFGDVYLELQEQISRYHNLEIRIALKEADPGLTTEALEERVAEKERERRKEIETQRMLAAFADTDYPLRKVIVVQRGLEGWGADGPGSSEYRRECKKTLVELWFLLHPDKLLLNPAYEKLTEKQRQYLEDLGRRVLEVKPHELHLRSAAWGQDLRSLESLREALAEVKAVFKHAGLEVDVKRIVQGETLAEQIEWLEQANHRLEHEIELLKARLRALMEDPDIRWKRTIVSHPEEHERVRAELVERGERHRKKADALEERLNHLFEEDAHR